MNVTLSVFFLFYVCLAAMWRNKVYHSAQKAHVRKRSRITIRSETQRPTGV